MSHKSSFHISDSVARKIVLILFLLYTIAYSTLTILRHKGFNSSSFDLAIIDQTLWNTSRGRLFETTLEHKIQSKNYLAIHFSPILLFFAPLYWIWDNVFIILIFQSAFLGSGVLAVYRLTYQELDSAHWGLVFCLLYIFYTPLGFINRFDFHKVAFAIPLILFAWVFQNEGRWKATGICLGLALICKESVGLTLFAAGLSMAFTYTGRRRFWLVWSLISLAVSLAAYFYIIPFFNRGSIPISAGRYAWLGNNPVEMIKQFITHPLKAFAYQLGIGLEGQMKILGGMRRVYPLKMLLPLSFLPLLGWPIIMAAIPAFCYNMLSSNYCQASIYFQYNSPIIPFLFIGAVLGFKKVIRRCPSRTWVQVLIAAILLIPCAISFIHDNPFTRVVELPFFQSYALQPVSGIDEFYEAARLIPPEASVQASCAFAPHLSHRREIYHLHWKKIFADYLILNVTDFRWHMRTWYIEAVFRHPGYEVIYSKNNVVLLKAKKLGRDTRAGPGAISTLPLVARNSGIFG